MAQGQLPGSEQRAGEAPVGHDTQRAERGVHGAHRHQRLGEQDALRLSLGRSLHRRAGGGDAARVARAQSIERRRQAGPQGWRRNPVGDVFCTRPVAAIAGVQRGPGPSVRASKLSGPGRYLLSFLPSAKCVVGDEQTECGRPVQGLTIVGAAVVAEGLAGPSDGIQQASHGGDFAAAAAEMARDGVAQQSLALQIGVAGKDVGLDFPGLAIPGIKLQGAGCGLVHLFDISRLLGRRGGHGEYGGGARYGRPAAREVRRFGDSAARERQPALEVSLDALTGVAILQVKTERMGRKPAGIFGGPYQPAAHDFAHDHRHASRRVRVRRRQFRARRPYQRMALGVVEPHRIAQVVAHPLDDAMQHKVAAVAGQSQVVVLSEGVAQGLGETRGEVGRDPRAERLEIRERDGRRYQRRCEPAPGQDAPRDQGRQDRRRHAHPPPGSARQGPGRCA